jgi:hypothetical protein
MSVTAHGVAPLRGRRFVSARRWTRSVEDGDLHAKKNSGRLARPSPGTPHFATDREEMMRSRIRQMFFLAVVAAGLVVVVGTALAQRGTANASGIGVWRLSERTTTGPNATTVPVQPGVWIFTPHYYYFVIFVVRRLSI